MRLIQFDMERWQSTFEHRVDFNLSESGVHPLTAGELLALADGGPKLESIRLGYGQSNGSDELRRRIAALYPGATEDHVVVTTGGIEANLVAFWHLLQPGQALAAMMPNYMQVPGLMDNTGGTVLPFHLLEEQGWSPDFDALADALANGARTILITNPNNPTGRVLREDEMDRIVALADDHEAWILSDEVYQGAELSDRETPSFWGRSNRVIVTNSLSKAYALPGLRIGWAVAPPDVVERLWARTDYTTISPASLSDTLATVALSEEVRSKLLARTRAILQNNFRVLQEWMEGCGGLFSYQAPDAGAICMVRYHAPVDSLELAETLRRDYALLVVPGAHFGYESMLRLGFGPPEEELREALSRLESAFTAVRAA
ncbi:MAG: aminotransferase class I/II-fold pyridoxal phosphate-dependent enzyme [Gemmatimonadetes bacterium]|nr:aminotransferase class I/II-fold pyridoxal phosphate-dependent enzyme [Gemmatimonadota bacterium]